VVYSIIKSILLQFSVLRLIIGRRHELLHPLVARGGSLIYIYARIGKA
jgi:hypothetical protein